MDLEYLVQLDPVYSHICDHLRTNDLLTLSEVSVPMRRLVNASPNTWRHLDLFGRREDVVMHYLRLDAVPGALQILVLDCSDISETGLLNILMRCPNIQYLGLGGCTTRPDELVAAVLAARQGGIAKRLKYLNLLGAPHFKTTGVNGIAAAISSDLTKAGIDCDLVRCPQEHAFTSDPEYHWHLALDTSSTCASCDASVRGCYPCINSRTCRGCFKFWCFSCENPISRVCYECGHSCTACKQGIYVKCSDCGSMFCKLHREDDRFTRPRSSNAAYGRTQVVEANNSKATDSSCDWCIQGRNRGYGH